MKTNIRSFIPAPTLQASWSSPDSSRRKVVFPEHAGDALQTCVRESLGSTELTAAHEADGAEQLLCCRRNGSLASQHYILDMTQWPAILQAADDSGFWYGFQTFLELYASRQAGRVEDGPQFLHRGYMLDISRGRVPRMDFLKERVRQLSRLRINELQLYVEHTFAFRFAPGVWADSGAMTAGQFQELDAYCRLHFIELIPNINTFGHMGNWFSLPEYAPLAECPGGWYFEPWDCVLHGVLKPCGESMALIQSILDEYLPCFSSSRCNIGCDETFELGHGASEKLCAQKGVAAVFADHVNGVCSLAARHGKSAQMWADMLQQHPAAMEFLPASIQMMVWKYEHEDDFEEPCAAMARRGYSFYTCPGTGAWTTPGGRTDNMLENIQKAARAALNHGAAGMMLTDWGDWAHINHPVISWAPLAYFSLAAWHLPWATEERFASTVAWSFLDGASFAEELCSVLLALGRAGRSFHYQPRGCTPFWMGAFPTASRAWKRFAAETRPEEIIAAYDVLNGLSARIEALPVPYAAILSNTLAITTRLLDIVARRFGLSPAAQAPRGEKAQLIRVFEDLWLENTTCSGLPNARHFLDNLMQTGG